MISEIDRAGKRWYETEIGLVPSVSTVCSIADADLAWWEAKMAAQYAVEHIEGLLERLGDRALVTEIAEAAARYRDERAVLGTEIHSFIDRWAGNQDPIPTDYSRAAQPYIKQFLLAAQELQIWPILAEELIWSPHGYAGRLDLVCSALVDSHQQRLVVDIKTGKSVYGKVRLQLAAYRYGCHDGSEETVSQKYEIDGCAVLHLRPKSARLVPVEAGDAEYREFRYCREAFLAATRLDQRVSPPCN